ncbi:MAG: hypothetical protein HUU10_04380 [Bacteroidetes bacterium]|nr:hypothetical protein [Bacteroidota bacterium]
MTKDGNTQPIGYCAGGECQHMTPEDASICYRRFLIEQKGGRWPGGFPMKDAEKTSTRVINMHSSY